MVDDQGQRYMLPKTMIFMGHEECDFIIEGSSVDKRHAVVTFDHYLNKFKIKDLSTIHGTFINDVRIPEQEYITLEEKYTIRLGFSQSVYYIEQVFDTPYNVEEENGSPDKITTWPSNSHETMDEVDLAYYGMSFNPYSYNPETVNQEAPNHEEFEEQQRSNGNLQQNYESSYNGYISNDPNHTWPRKRRPKSWTSQSNYSSQLAEEKKRSSYHVESTVDAEQDYLNSIPPSIMKPSHSTLGNLQSQNNNLSYTKSDFVSMEGVPSAPEKTQPPVSHNNQISVKSPSYSEAGGANENNTYRTRNDITRIKKVTPLYGQPSWWGEPDIVENDPVDSSNSSQNQKKKCNDSETSDKPTKPGNLAVYNLQTDTSHNLEKYKNDPKYACTYMEISHRDFELENNSACRGSLSSSISKDSLVSHDSRKGSLEISSDHGKKQSSSERELSVEKTEPVNKVADAGGTAFTVEIGEQKPRKWNSLSEFMPSKIRRSFRERSERAMKQSTKDGTAPKFVEADSPPEQAKDGEILGEKGKAKTPKASQSSEGEEENHSKAKKDVNGKNNKISPSSFQTYKPASHQNDNEEISPPTCSGAASFLINKMFQGSNCPANVNPASTSPPSDYCLIPGSGAPASTGKFFDPSTEQDRYYDQKNLNGNKYCETTDKTCTDSSPEAQDLEAIEDKLSEAGTYTIEGDQEAKEEEELARKRIDNVFGVGQNIQRPIIVELKNLEQDSSTLGKESSEMNHVGKFLEDSKFYLNNGSNNNCSPEADVDQMEDIENLKDISPESNTCDIIPQNSEKTLAESEFKPQSESSGSSPLVSKPPLGCPRKRAGTGRKLPSLPAESGVPPSSKPQKQTTPQKKEEKWTSSDVGKKKKSFLTSNQSNGGNRTRSKVDTDHDTDRLLKDTETAMAALEARVTNPSISQGTDGSESDVSSNTNYNFSKNSALRSSNRSLSDQPSSRKSSFSDNAKPKASSKNVINSKERNPPIQRNYSKGSEKGSISSDITSESEALETMSNNSDFSLECGSEGDGYNRRGSKGKGGISMTRPNRAFQLRQAKARGAEVVDKPPPHSGSGRGTSLSSTVSKASMVKGKVKRVNSVNLPAERLSETQRSTGLSTESIHKSYENIKGSSNFMRTDGGRYSLRVRRSASTSTPRNSNESSRIRSELKSTKSQLKAAHSTPGLNIVSLSSKSNSQPTSRSNSPRSVDKNNLKRRKEFNQRQQKSSTGNLSSGSSTDTKNTKTQGSASKAECSEVSINSRMIRSASLELSKYKNSVDAVSSQKSSSRSYRDVSNIGEDRIKSGFVPYSGLGTFQSCLRHPEEFDYGNEERLLLPKSMQETLPLVIALSPVHLYKLLGSQLSTDMSLNERSYDNIIISSIYQLSLKLKTATDRTIQKLRESNKVSQTPSPVDDYLTDPSSSEMPAWKSANQELAAILCILRKIEHRIHVIDRVLFPDKDNGIDSDGLTQREKQLYLQEIERIRTEIAGFQPIDNPEDKMWKKKQRHPQGNSSTCHAIGLTEEELF
ncbi:of 170 kDa-like isoform X6 [Octopus vulgaris]|uniref:Of 170 kDa-like isoform X6 n=2 Tax=Octopus vulgaris TaxID=6645 RepID=A0AA36FD90_OCTVU|nr:of 170 kDa-like isoform X6 [Octopus vulgaris]